MSCSHKVWTPSEQCHNSTLYDHSRWQVGIYHMALSFSNITSGPCVGHVGGAGGGPVLWKTYTCAFIHTQASFPSVESETRNKTKIPLACLWLLFYYTSRTVKLTCRWSKARERCTLSVFKNSVSFFWAAPGTASSKKKKNVSRSIVSAILLPLRLDGRQHIETLKLR